MSPVASAVVSVPFQTPDMSLHPLGHPSYLHHGSGEDRAAAGNHISLVAVIVTIGQVDASPLRGWGQRRRC